MMPVPPPDQPNEIAFACPDCQRQLKMSADSAGKHRQCPWCGQWIPVPAVGGSAAPARYDRYQDPYQLSEHERAEYERLRAQQYTQDGGGGGGISGQAWGWIIFILIFGVGNVILYATTGIFLIPIPRR
jgi:hypothetical protein